MNGIQKLDHSFKAMSTEFKFTLYLQEMTSDLADRVLEEARQLVKDLESDLSEYTESGSLARIHQADVTEVVETSIHFRDLMKLALRLKTASASSFDPFVKSPVPIKESDYFFDPRLALFQKHNPALRLSFGAIGKGYALDQVSRLLRAKGFSAFVLSAGGSSILRHGIGQLETEREIFWTCDKQAGENSDSAYSGLNLRVRSSEERGGMAYSVSAEYERGAHIVRRQTGASLSANGLKTTLVAHPSAAISDALSTAFFADDWPGMRHWQETEITTQAAFLSLDQAGIPSWNARASDLFDLPESWGHA